MADRQPRVVLHTNVLVSALIAQNRGWDTPPLRCLGLVRTTGRLAVLRRDDADNLVIETALNGRARRLLTGNVGHFAELWTPGAPPVFQGVRVVTPRQFVDSRR